MRDNGQEEIKFFPTLSHPSSLKQTRTFARRAVLTQLAAGGRKEALVLKGVAERALGIEILDDDFVKLMRGLNRRVCKVGASQFELK